MNKGTIQDIIFRYWGKTGSEDNGDFHQLVWHSLDVAAVGQVLLDRHPFLLDRLSKLMRLSREQAKRWIVFLLGLHDLGKFAETFQQQREDLRQRLWPDQEIRLRNYEVRHDSLGMILWDEALAFDLFPEAPDEALFDVLPHWLAPVFGHHGEPPRKKALLKNHFRNSDQQAALAFCREWLDLIRPDEQTLAERSRNRKWVKRQKEASWLIAGIAVLCDWLGSNSHLFEYCDRPMPLADYWRKQALPVADEAIGQAGMLPPAVDATASPYELFDYIEQATPLQQACVELPIGRGPQLFILEDVTGAGKTEAAMILARRLMQAGQGQGIYVGLPTMATANAMYERMADVYRRLYEEPSKPSLILSHSARHLSDAFRESLFQAQAEDSPYGKEESIGAQCNRWLADNRKKALLADVGVGTIDQALLGVMPARHQSLRLLGLANKVLILDEVHAYDSYTLQPLKRLLQFHATFGGSAILLSATLSRAQREELLGAFAGESVPTEQTDYPLLSHYQRDGGGLLEQPVATREAVRREVGTALLHDEAAVLGQIRQMVDAGQCVCWIRNTVQDARDAWRLLAAQDWMDEDRLHLFHSRYALGDRLSIEQAMLARFGKDSAPKQRAGQVLVATQVVEQSLDLDFDAMISDLAPIDLLIQRAGRLQRHVRGARPEPVLHVLGPEPVDDPQSDWYEALFPRAAFVYAHTAVLWRTARWLARNGGWRMPDDARDMIETVYDPDDTPEGLLENDAEAQGRTMSERNAGAFGSLRLETGYRDTERWDDEAVIATRLGEESQTVYLARWQDGKLSPWIGQDAFAWDLSSLRVNASQFHQVVQNEDSPWKAALDALVEGEKRFDTHSFILVLSEQDGEWLGRISDESGREWVVLYSPETGLERRP